MKSSYKIISTLLLVFITTSCLQNNGNIGNFFGKWKLYSMETEDDQIPFDDIYVNFQSQVFGIQEIYTDNHESTELYSSYKTVEDSIYVWNFCYTEENVHLFEKLNIEKKDAFYIRENTKKSLILEKGKYRWLFKKW